MKLKLLLGRFRGIYLVGALLVMVGAVVYFANTAPAARAEVNHGQVVPDTVRRDLPVTLDGRVRAHAQVGNRVFVGGDFTQVELQDGTVVNQPFLYAYDINSGAFDTSFRPVLNNEVEELEANATDDGLYVGGRFTRWEANGSTNFPLRVAKLDAFGNLDTGFSANASAVVLSLEQVGNDLYLGGNFITVGGQSIRGLARVNANTGALDTNFNFQLDGSIAGANLVRRVEATPDGNELFVLHYNQQVLGQTRQAVFKADISGPNTVLSNWEVPWEQQTNDRLCWNALRDMAISPDGSFIVIGGQGADNPPNCDSVLRYETAGNAVQPFTWSARMYSSIFSLAVTDAAVYVGGHFCAAPLLGAVYPGGYTSNFTGTANGCSTDPNDPVNPSEIDSVNAVYRNQLAALNPTTAQALPWNPGSNNSLGVFDLTPTDRGLLAGHDGNRFSNFLVGGSGFFDLGGAPDTTAPTITVNAPVDDAVLQSLSTISGVASDDQGVAIVRIRLFNRDQQLWVRPDGSLSSTAVDFPVTVTNTGIGQVDWSIPVPNLSPAEYDIRGFAEDAADNRSVATNGHRFTISSGPQCTVALNAAGQPVVSYSGFNGPATVFVRVDGGFLSGTPGGSGSFTDSAAADGPHSYLIRWRPNGVTSDIACTPTPITVGGGTPPPPPPPPPPGGSACTVTVNGNGDPVLTWDPVAGVSAFFVREAGEGFISTVNGGLSFTDVGRADGTYSYVIRHRAGGTVDRSCTPDPFTLGGNAPPPPPPPAEPCTASVAANGNVNLTWTAIAGEDVYQVRDNGGWVANAGAALSFTDTNPDSGSRTYVIRNRDNNTGAVNDRTCNTVNVP